MWPWLAAGGAGLVAAVFAALWRGARAKADLWMERAARQKADKDELSAALGQAEADAGEERARLERVVRNLKAEIAKLDEELDLCESPAIVRDRLRRLLAAPEKGRTHG